jgi:hypothetical protein
VIDVKVDELKAAAKDFIDTLLPIAEASKTLAEGTTLDALQWGIIGSPMVSGAYNPVCEYQAKQAHDFVKCLNGIYAGLLSVVIHYREADLVASTEVARIAELRTMLQADREALTAAQNSDQGPTD